MASAFIETTGALAAVLTTLCWVPQALKIIRDRETRAISLTATMLSALGVLLWLIYGVAIANAPLIGSSAATFAITATIVALKIRHG
jgi:MtN3 and saliva related transmembrane protein